MNYKEPIKTLILKGLYVGIVWYALQVIATYTIYKLVNYGFANILLTVIGQVIAIITAYLVVNLIINYWHASRSTKGIVVFLSVLIAVGIMLYDLAHLLAMRV